MSQQAKGSASPTAEPIQQQQRQPSYERGWLWKRAIGRSFFGRRNWKMRFVESDPHSLRYYSNEPFERAKGAVLWRNVVHVYEEAPLDFKSETAEDRPTFHFGLRFRSHDTNQEMLLMFRTDDEEEHQHWVDHFRYMHEQFGDQDEDDGGESQLRSGVVERFSKKLRSLVSLQKTRYVEDGLDLDLAYITPSIIAMGFPCEGREELFRNPMSHVVKFFDKYHKKRFKVYNLCSERFYPPNRFGGSFERFPFDDHNPCPLQMLLLICDNVFEFVSEGGERMNTVGPQVMFDKAQSSQMSDMPVAALHCKAGKGRTGLVICAFILFAGICRTAQDSMSVFARRRTKDGKGIQIPSQKRYLDYFHSVLYNYNGAIPSAAVTLGSLVLSHSPMVEGDGSSTLFIKVEARGKHHRHVPLGRTEGRVNAPLDVLADTCEGSGGGLVRTVKGSTTISLPINTSLVDVGDFRVVLLHRYKAGNDIELCSFWLHTGFLSNSSTTIAKDMLDDAVKDKRHHRFPAGFRVTLSYTVDAPGPTIPPTGRPIPACEH